MLHINFSNTVDTHNGVKKLDVTGAHTITERNSMTYFPHMYTLIDEVTMIK